MLASPFKKILTLILNKIKVLWIHFFKRNSYEKIITERQLHKNPLVSFTKSNRNTSYVLFCYDNTYFPQKPVIVMYFSAIIALIFNKSKLFAQM